MTLIFARTTDWDESVLSMKLGLRQPKSTSRSSSDKDSLSLFLTLRNDVSPYHIIYNSIQNLVPSIIFCTHIINMCIICIPIALTIEEFKGFLEPIQKQAMDIHKAWTFSSPCPKIVV